MAVLWSAGAIVGQAEWLRECVQLWLTTERLREVLAMDNAALCENDIPGASLDGRSPTTQTMPALKRWLQCRAAPTKGKKADLVER